MAAVLQGRLLRAVVFLCLMLCCHGVKECLRNMAVKCPQCSEGYGPYPNCSRCIDDRLDPSSNCTQCKCGEPNCYMGNFTLSILFHSYLNQQHLCAECNDSGPICCDTMDMTDNCPNDCVIRMVVSVEPYGSPLKDVILPRHQPDFKMDCVAMFEEGDDVFNESEISNPYKVQLNTWTGRFQFYIVVYDFYLPMPNDPLKGRYAVDRFAINVDLSAVPDYRCRQKYYGIYNISQFDLSFEIGCSENFLGLGCNISSPDCNTSFTTVPVPLCNEPGSEIPVTTSAPSLPTGSTSDSNNATVGGAIGGVVAVVIASLLCFILVFLLCRQRRRKRKADLTEMKHDGSAAAIRRENDFDNPIYNVEEEAKDAYMGEELVYSQPSSSKLNGKTETTDKGNDGREFHNSIYGHDLVSSTYSQPVVESTSSHSSATNSNRQTQEASRSAQNGAVTYAVLDGRTAEQYDVVAGSDDQYHTADVVNQKRYIKLRPPIDRYEMANSSGNEQYDVACQPNDEHYDVAHPPRTEHYDVAHMPNDHLPSDHYDVAHLPNDQYDVAHPPSDHYDVAHPPSDQYDVVHPPSDQYDVAHPPSDQYDVAHPPSDQYDVAHPPPMVGHSDVLNKPASDRYEMAHSSLMPHARGDQYDDVVVQQGNERYDDVVLRQGNEQYDDVLLQPADDQYDVAHPPPRGQDSQYDIAHVPNGWNKEAKQSNLEPNPRYESSDMQTVNFYSVVDPSLESTSHTANQYSAFQRDN